MTSQLPTTNYFKLKLLYPVVLQKLWNLLLLNKKRTWVPNPGAPLQLKYTSAKLLLLVKVKFFAPVPIPNQFLQFRTSINWQLFSVVKSSLKQHNKLKVLPIKTIRSMRLNVCDKANKTLWLGSVTSVANTIKMNLNTKWWTSKCKKPWTQLKHINLNWLNLNKAKLDVLSKWICCNTNYKTMSNRLKTLVITLNKLKINLLLQFSCLIKTDKSFIKL